MAYKDTEEFWYWPSTKHKRPKKSLFMCLGCEPPYEEYMWKQYDIKNDLRYGHIYMPDELFKSKGAACYYRLKSMLTK